MVTLRRYPLTANVLLLVEGQKAERGNVPCLAIFLILRPSKGFRFWKS